MILQVAVPLRPFVQLEEKTDNELHKNMEQPGEDGDSSRKMMIYSTTMGSG
jgi:hypothetical protein